MSTLLREFLGQWLAWVDGGAPSNAPFSSQYGLCSNLACRYNELTGISDAEIDGLLDELNDAFIADGYPTPYPFGGKGVFASEAEGKTQHLNPARVFWVRSKVAELASA